MFRMDMEMVSTTFLLRINGLKALIDIVGMGSDTQA